MSRSMMEPFYENSEEPKADKGRELFSYIWVMTSEGTDDAL